MERVYLKFKVQSFSVISECQMHSSVCSILYITVNKMIAHHFCFASFCNYEERRSCSNMNRYELAYMELHL